MINEVFASDETVALAKEKACKMLGVSEDKVEFEVRRMPSKKVFGMFGGKSAQVRAILKKSIAQKAVDYLKEIFYYMGLETLSLEIVSATPECCEIRATGDDVRYIVGKHGETLDALQYVVGLAVNDKQKNSGFCKIRLEAGDYRAKRKKTLETLGKHMAEKVLKTNKKLSLEPMRAYERKIIHTAVGEIFGVCSRSEGEGEQRHIVIVPKTEDK